MWTSMFQFYSHLYPLFLFVLKYKPKGFCLVQHIFFLWQIHTILITLGLFYKIVVLLLSSKHVCLVIYLNAFNTFLYFYTLFGNFFMPLFFFHYLLYLGIYWIQQNFLFFAFACYYLLLWNMSKPDLEWIINLNFFYYKPKNVSKVKQYMYVTCSGTI